MTSLSLKSNGGLLNPPMNFSIPWSDLNMRRCTCRIHNSIISILFAVISTEGITVMVMKFHQTMCDRNFITIMKEIIWAKRFPKPMRCACVVNAGNKMKWFMYLCIGLWVLVNSSMCHIDQASWYRDTHGLYQINCKWRHNVLASVSRVGRWVVGDDDDGDGCDD